MPKNNFFIFTADHSGLPLAERLKEEGNNVTLVMIRPEERCGKLEQPKTPEEAKENQKRTKYLEKNGSGIVNKVWASEALYKIKTSDYVIFDQIYGFQYGEQLRKRGVRVLGGSQDGYLLETERRDTLALLKRLGFDVPLQKYFGNNSSKKAIEFLNKAGDDILFVFKSDNPKVVTQVAYDSNDELVQKLTAEGKAIDTDGFLLQQKVEGVEAAVETWLCNGIPILSNIDLEAKKKYNEMSEVQTGCSFQLLWNIAVDHELRKRVNEPLDKLMSRYFKTGLFDVSFIYEPKEDKYWILEMCGSRFAYNAFYSTLALLDIEIGEFFVKYMDGEYKTDISEKVFKPEFAGSLRIFNDENTPDQQAIVDKEYKECCWLWDVYKKSGQLLTTGYDSIGIITATGENPESAMAQLRQNYFKLHMPTKWSRDDFDEDDEPGLPLARYHQMKRLNLI